MELQRRGQTLPECDKIWCPLTFWPNLHCRVCPSFSKKKLGWLTYMPYQYQFVKTRFRCVWSNRDMGIFSFWPISPQFAKQSPPKPLKSVHPWESHFGGTIFHALGMFLDYLGAFLCSFCDETLFSETFFQYFLHFKFVKTRSHRKKWQMGVERVLINL